MAERLRSSSASRDSVPDQPPPPPLSSIRVKGQGGRGLKKPAILIAVGGSVGLVLVLASGGFSPDPSKKPAEIRPMMSDPARPEMAQTAIRRLPTNYEEAARTQGSFQPAPPPILGPPLAGDIAAFAPVDAGYPVREGSWTDPGDTHVSATTAPTLADDEVLEADRSGIIFALNYQQPGLQAPPNQIDQQQQDPLSALRQGPVDQPAPPQMSRSDRALHSGTVISASLVTAVNSEAPGPVIAQVTQAIYDSATGRTPLIPQGARLMGEYRSSARYGQSRVAIIWSRLIMPDGREIVLDEAALDPSGAAGIQGDVDNHWLDAFGAATLGTLINIGVATTEDQPGLIFSGVGLASNRDPVAAAIHDGVQQTASAVTNRIVDRSLMISPTIKLNAGTRISAITSRRLSF